MSLLSLDVLLGNLTRTLITADDFPTGNYNLTILAGVDGRNISVELPITLSG